MQLSLVFVGRNSFDYALSRQAVRVGGDEISVHQEPDGRLYRIMRIFVAERLVQVGGGDFSGLLAFSVLAEYLQNFRSQFRHCRQLKRPYTIGG